MYSIFIFSFGLVISCADAKPAWWSNKVADVYDNEPVQRQHLYPIGVNSQNGDIIFYDREILYQPWPSSNSIQLLETDDTDKIIFGSDVSSTTRKTQFFGNEGLDGGQSPTKVDFTSTARPDWSTTTVSFINQSPDFPPGTVNACQRRCMLGVTAEYNPFCGSDGVTYSNPGKVLCAQRCGKDIRTRSGNCGVTSPQV